MVPQTADKVKNCPSVAKAALVSNGIMYGLKPVPFKLKSDKAPFSYHAYRFYISPASG
jgi:hypothetical protein